MQFPAAAETANATMAGVGCLRVGELSFGGWKLLPIEFGVGGDSRFIRGLDYYWAASDYWDVLFSSAYNERSRVDRTSQAAVLRSADDTRNLQLAARLRHHAPPGRRR